MRTFIIWAMFLALMVHSTVTAQEFPLQPQTEGGITFVSGGVGKDENIALKAMEGSYNLRLLFAAKGTGEFLSDVKVTIQDAKKNTLLAVVAQGPKFFARLVPGTYRLIMDYEGKEVSKSITISGKKTVSLSFYWQAPVEGIAE